MGALENYDNKRNADGSKERKYIIHTHTHTQIDGQIDKDLEFVKEVVF